MKVLRVFAIEHFDHRTVFVERKNQTEHKWSKRQISVDFPVETSPEFAKEVMHKQYGAPPELVCYKYPPDRFVRIQNWTRCDDTPEVGVIEPVRAYQPDLLSATDLKAAQTTKPTKRK